MAARIAIIQSHPDARGGRFGHALAGAYAAGATEAGHETAVLDVARLEFPLVRTRDEWEQGAPPEAIRRAQDEIARAQHLVIFHPLRLGSMPALLKGFLEQALRPGFAIGMVKAGNNAARGKWLEKPRALGRAGR